MIWDFVTSLDIYTEASYVWEPLHSRSAAAVHSYVLPAILEELHDVNIVASFITFLILNDSLHAKADPLDQPKRAQSPSAYAAMEEFKQSQLGSGYDEVDHE